MRIIYSSNTLCHIWVPVTVVLSVIHMPLLALTFGAVVVTVLQTPLAQFCKTVFIPGLSCMMALTSSSGGFTMLDNNGIFEGVCGVYTSLFSSRCGPISQLCSCLSFSVAFFCSLVTHALTVTYLALFVWKVCAIYSRTLFSAVVTTALRSALAENCSELMMLSAGIIFNLTLNSAENRVKLGQYGACQGASIIFGNLERLCTTIPILFLEMPFVFAPCLTPAICFCSLSYSGVTRASLACQVEDSAW